MKEGRGRDGEEEGKGVRDGEEEGRGVREGIRRVKDRIGRGREGDKEGGREGGE